MSPEPPSPPTASLAHVGKRPFASFTAPSIQLAPLVGAHSSAVGPKGLFIRLRFIGPDPALLPTLGHIRAHACGGNFPQQPIFVVTLFPHHLLAFRLPTRQH